MSTPPEIKDFNQLIEPQLNGGKVLNHSTRYLTKPGDNYGSTMLAVTVDVQSPLNPKNVEKLEIVAKLPPTNEVYWNLFQPDLTFGKENNCYIKIAPALQQLQREANVPEEDIINVFPKCYGSRVSLDKNAIKADKDAALLLENLVIQGYRVSDRFEGFDYDHAVLILDNLAKFHVLPIVLRNLKPKVFDETVRSNLKRFNIEEGFGKERSRELKESIYLDLKKLPGITDQMLEQIRKNVARHDKYMENPNECEDTLFTTFAHYDFWVNNMLIQYAPNGKPMRVKFVDFQISQYESFAHDLVFFLFTSVQTNVALDKFDELLDLYFEKFLKYLNQTKLPAEDYSKKILETEVNRLAPIQLGHILIMLKVVFTKTEELKDFSDVHPDILLKKETFDETYYSKLREVVLLYHKKGWLE